MDESNNQLGRFLEEGWDIAGYSASIVAAGVIAHSILLRKASNLNSVTVVKSDGKEIGRSVDVLSPFLSPSKHERP